MKLSKRLTAIVNATKLAPYDHIWDCCCDHGYLGQQLMLQHPNSQIHFVDVVPHLIEQVEAQLITSSLSNWQCHCLDAADIELTNLAGKNQKHLIIIAGVGGDLLMDMVKAIYNKHSYRPNKPDLDFILCPVRQLHTVRQGLLDLELGLISEQIIQDNKLFYEVIHVSSQSAQAVSLVGNHMWNFSNSDHQTYRQIMMDHYQKQPNSQAKKLLSLYQALTESDQLS